MNLYRNCLLALTLVIALIALAASDGDRKPVQGKAIQLLFLGDGGHHDPSARVVELKHALGKEGIFLTYTENLGDLNPGHWRIMKGVMTVE